MYLHYCHCDFVLTMFSFVIRNVSWLEAQHHCRSRNMSLFQYDKTHDLDIQYLHYSTAQDFGEVTFVGLTRNDKVSLLLLEQKPIQNIR